MYRKYDYVQPNYKRMIALFFIFLVSYAPMFKRSYLNDDMIYWTFLPATVLLAIAGVVVFILRRVEFKDAYPITKMSIINILGIGLIIYFVCFVSSLILIDTVNGLFSNVPETLQCEVIEKKIYSTGTKGEMRFWVKVNINDEAVKIDVPVTDYYELQKGDIVYILFYDGFFKFAFYEYSGEFRSNSEGTLNINYSLETF